MEQTEKVPAIGLYSGAGNLIWCALISIASIPLALFVFSLFARYFYYAELIGNFRCQIMFMLMPCAFILLGIRRTFFSLLVLVALAWSMIGIVWVYLPALQPAPGPNVIRVMSHNVLGQNKNKFSVMSQVRKYDPDVLVVVEYSRNWHDALTYFDNQFPHQAVEPRWHGFGLAIFSKFPIEKTEVFQLTGKQTDNPFVVTTINKDGQTVRVAGIHVLSPTNRFRMKLRNEQFAEAADILAQENVPTVVMGDFNCTPWSPFLSDFMKTTGYRDSRQGFGYHGSWPQAKFWPLAIPIDHAFVSEKIHVHDRQLGTHAGSDHRALVLDISIAD